MIFLTRFNTQRTSQKLRVAAPEPATVSRPVQSAFPVSDGLRPCLSGGSSRQGAGSAPPRWCPPGCAPSRGQPTRPARRPAGPGTAPATRLRSSQADPSEVCRRRVFTWWPVAVAVHASHPAWTYPHLHGGPAPACALPGRDDLDVGPVDSGAASGASPSRGRLVRATWLRVAKTSRHDLRARPRSRSAYGIRTRVAGVRDRHPFRWTNALRCRHCGSRRPGG